MPTRSPANSNSCGALISPGSTHRDSCAPNASYRCSLGEVASREPSAPTATIVLRHFSGCDDSSRSPATMMTSSSAAIAESPETKGPSSGSAFATHPSSGFGVK